MPGNVYYEKLKRPDGRYIFVAKSKGNHVPIVVSANSYSSQDDCERAIDGLDPEHDDKDDE